MKTYFIQDTYAGKKLFQDKKNINKKNNNEGSLKMW